MNRNRSFFRSLLFALLVLGLIAPAAQAVLFVPSGLNPGDEYHIAFVTSASRTANSTDIAEYNTFVNDQAGLSALTAGVNYSAVASTEDVDAVDNVGSSSAPIYLLNDTLLVAIGTAGLWDGNILNPFRIDQLGNTVNPGDEDVWTGTDSDGTAFPDGWLGAANPRYGEVQWTNSFWTSFDDSGSNNTNRFYAISEVLTVIPEPGTAALLGLGLTGIAAGGRSRRRATRETV